MKVLSVSILAVSVLGVTLACSGGGGGGAGGGSGGSTAPSMLATNKMSCNGATCIGTGSLNALHTGGEIEVMALIDAVNYYNGFNTQLIPALNNVIRIIETGVANAGAESCNDIGVPFAGPVAVDGITYNAKTLTSNATAPSDFTTTVMAKTIAAEIASSNTAVIRADVACGGGTDANPLVARVMSLNGTSKLNAWFEKGSLTHVRILMVAEHSGTKYGAWFKTDDGVNFEMIIASSGAVYKAVGSKAADRIAFRGLGDVADTCLVASTGSAATGQCGSMSTTTLTMVGIPTSLANSAVTWANMPSVVITPPTY